MKCKIWAYALIAVATAGCGGGPGSNPGGNGSGGNGSGGGGGNTQKPLTTIELAVDSAGVDIGAAQVTVWNGNKDMPWGTLAAYQSKPYQADCGSPVAVEAAFPKFMFGTLPTVVDYEPCKQAAGGSALLKGVAAVNVEGKWSCDASSYVNGVPKGTSSKLYPNYKMLVDDTAFGKLVFNVGGNDAGFPLTGYAIAGVDSQKYVYKGQVAADGQTLDFEQSKDSVAAKYHCVRQ
ncbi:hypothetical protein EPN90_04770 [Patescibacteria group bacterium]|nr:MAG: hypothetical protein EPN90_04770 [Patescibacteria group bacterium]